MSYLKEPKDPLWDVLFMTTGKDPPDYVRGCYSSKELPEDKQETLLDWCATYAQPFWLTGVGLLEAVDRQVEEAVSNGNIPPKP